MGVSKAREMTDIRSIGSGINCHAIYFTVLYHHECGSWWIQTDSSPTLFLTTLPPSSGRTPVLKDPRSSGSVKMAGTPRVGRRRRLHAGQMGQILPGLIEEDIAYRF